MALSPTNESDPQFTSFANPNYQLHQEEANADAKLLASGGNIYEDVDTLSGDHSSGPSTPKNDTSKRRKKYAQLDLMSMGIDHTKDPVSEMKKSSPVKPTADQIHIDDEDDLYASIDVGSLRDSVDEIEQDSDNDLYSMPVPVSERQAKVTDSFMTYYASLEESLRKRKEEQGIVHSSDEEGEGLENPSGMGRTTECVNSPDSNDSGIQVDNGLQHIKGPVNEDVYAVITKPKKQPKDKQIEEDVSEEEVLPYGWEKHSDEDGPYYWHVKSGTIQRDPPPPDPPGVKPEKQPSTSHSKPKVPEPTSDAASEHLQEFEGHAFKYAYESLKGLEQPQDTLNSQSTDAASSEEKAVRFAVRSLGWVQIAEEDLTPERSSKAVNKCIVDLSLGRNDINDVVGRWGDGKDLFMDLDSTCLKLIDPQDFTLLNLQPIQSIRVWGVGRDNGRDFAYVARDKTTRIHMCHVFRCDTPARHIANTLKDICKKIMLERSGTPGANQGAPLPASAGPQPRVPASRPTNLPNLEKAGHHYGQKINLEKYYRHNSFPTPMEEPKKTIRCHYLGAMLVSKPTGVDILNAAIDKLYAKVPRDKWTFVSVAVAPSTITISDHANPDKIVDECRVRFLSFLGIAIANVKMCAFIMHSAQDQFIAHVFHCEPSAGALCKTIEAACKLRYQKCLDSHTTTPDIKKQQAAKPEAQEAAPAPPSGTKEKVGHLGNQLKHGVQNVFSGVHNAFSKARKWKS